MRPFLACLAVWCFMPPPLAAETARPLVPDVVVATNGTGNFTSIQAAIAATPPGNRERRIILVKPGVYHEKLRIDANAVTLRGENRDQVRIEFAQGATEFRQQPDALGIGVVNINGDDCVIENLTIRNTQGVIGVHAFAVYGRGDRTVIQDCDILSEGNDTLSLWRTADRQFDERGAAAKRATVNGRYYHARLRVRGSVDFICPRGWCYLKDSEIYEVNPRAEAAIWHDGSRDPAMKFVIRHCQFDGAPEGWQLGRHHHDAQIFLLDCTFAPTMRDVAPHRVVYPLDGKPATDADRKRNAELDATNRWGERFYYWNSHRTTGDYPWLRDNLSTATGAPKPSQITAKWTFDGTWDPEDTTGPVIRQVTIAGSEIAVQFSESVTVKGRARVLLRDGTSISCSSGSGSETLVFTAAASVARDQIARLSVEDGAVIATQAAATLRTANLTLP